MNEYRYELEKYPLIMLSLIVHSGLIIGLIWLERDAFIAVPFKEDQYTTFSLDDAYETPQQKPSNQQTPPPDTTAAAPDEQLISGSFMAGPTQDIKDEIAISHHQPTNHEGEQQEHYAPSTEPSPSHDESAQQTEEVTPPVDASSLHSHNENEANGTMNAVASESASKEKELSNNVPPGAKRMGKKRRPKRKQMTFADFAQGFLHSIQGSNTQSGGVPSFSHFGTNPTKPISQEELKYLSYLQKFFATLRTAFDIAETPQQKGLSDKAHMIGISAIVNREGLLTTVSLPMRSDNALLDAYIEKIIRKTGPFPPLPEHMQKDSIVINFYIHIVPQTQRSGNFNIAAGI